MDLVVIQHIWSRIRQEWRAIPEADRPWGVWITRHVPLTATENGPALQLTPIVQAWFLEAGMEWPHERSVWAFERFWAMHFRRTWDVAERASPDPRYEARCFPIGHAAFAPYVDSQDICLETLWGGRWGLGGRLTFTPEGAIERAQLLWIS